MVEDEWITVEEAATILRLSVRQTHRAEVEKKTIGRRAMFLRADVERLAAETEAHLRPAPLAPRAEIMPAGEMLDYLRERDQDVRDAQTRAETAHQHLAQAMLEIGRLQNQLEGRLLPDEAAALQTREAQLEAQVAQLQAELDRLSHPDLPRPWWRRLIG